MLPEELIQQHPELLMIKAWVLQFSWRLDLQAKVLQQIEELLEQKLGPLCRIMNCKSCRLNYSC